jgi:putative FmdB family regulatory protein
MPLYEYQCETCGHRFEVIQKFSDAPLTACAKCEGPVRKLLSSPAIQFKGSGWYITDYARAGKKEGDARPAGEKTATSGSDSGGSAEPSAPASSSESKSTGTGTPSAGD